MFALAKFMFEPVNFLKNLTYMGQGMLIIMLVMCVLIGGTMLLNYTTAKIAAAREGKPDGTDEKKD